MNLAGIDWNDSKIHTRNTCMFSKFEINSMFWETMSYNANIQDMQINNPTSVCHVQQKAET